MNGWMRTPDGDLVEIEALQGWVSPRLGVRFGLQQGELELYGPDGSRFASYLELIEQRQQAQQQAQQAQARAEKLAAQLRALGIDPEA